MSTVQERRESEKLTYARDMFWGNKEKQELIRELLDKIYRLTDRIEKLEKIKESEDKA